MKTQWNDAPGGFHPASAPDFLPRRELERLQLGRLQAVVARAYEQVALFRGRMEERGSARDAVQALEDLAQLPFTVKTDLRDTYPFGLFACADGGDRPAARLHRAPPASPSSSPTPRRTSRSGRA